MFDMIMTPSTSTADIRVPPPLMTRLRTAFVLLHRINALCIMNTDLQQKKRTERGKDHRLIQIHAV